MHLLHGNVYGTARVGPAVPPVHPGYTIPGYMTDTAHGKHLLSSAYLCIASFQTAKPHLKC